jgi:hypothetical protein
VISEKITISSCGTTTIYDRTILFEQTLEIAGENFTDLLLVMLESPSRVFKFYFSRQYGLLAFGVGAPDMGESSMRFEYFHERIIDNPQLVFPTTDLKQIFAKAIRP